MVDPDFGPTLTVSNRDSQFNCWVNWKIMGQPCEFQVADEVDWTKFSGGTLSFHMHDMGAFAHAWAPLERRWEAEGAVVAMHATVSYNSVAHSCLPVGRKPGG
jgi:hypothetical protein